MEYLISVITGTRNVKLYRSESLECAMIHDLALLCEKQYILDVAMCMCIRASLIIFVIVMWFVM